MGRDKNLQGLRDSGYLEIATYSSYLDTVLNKLKISWNQQDYLISDWTVDVIKDSGGGGLIKL